MEKKITKKEAKEKRKKENKINKLVHQASSFFSPTRPGKSKGKMGMSKHRKAGTSAKNHTVTMAVQRDWEKLHSQNK